MSKKRFFWAAVMAAGIGLTTTAYQAPPLLLVEDEDGVVEQPAQTIPAKENNATDQRKTAQSAPAPSTAQGGFVLISEEEETAAELPAQNSAAAAPSKTTKSASVQPTAQGGLVLIDEEESTQVQDDRKAEEARLEQERIEAEKRAEEARLAAEKKAKAETDKKAREEAARIEKARQDSVKAAQEEAKRIEKARQDSINAAKAEAIRIEKMRQDSIRAAREEAIRIEQARQDSIQQAQEAERIRIEQARQDSVRQAQEAERIRIEQARQDSIQQAQEAERIRIEQARQDSIQQAQEAERIRIEQARQDSIQQAQEAERIRIEQARQDSIQQAQEAERIRIEQARQDSIRNAQKENDEKQTNAAVQVYVAPAASAPAQNTQSDDLNSKMLEAVQRAYEEALKQANKSDSIRLIQWQLEQELKKLQEQQAALDAQKQKEQEEKEAAEQAAAVAAQAAAQQQETAAQPEKETVFTRYYKHSGRNMLSILSVGYSTYFQVGPAVAAGASPTADAFKRHILNFELFEWRAKCFGMQMFNFEMGLNTPFVSEEHPEQNRYLFERGGYYLDERVEATAKTMWFAYKPAVKFYIPCTKWLAVELYGGVEVDLTKMWSKINSTYYTGYHNETNRDGLRIPEQNFFVGAYGGAGLMFTAVPQVPLEIKAEYRHPVKGNTALVPQGVYISAQVHLANPIKK